MNGDTVSEPHETFRIHLSHATNAVIVDKEALGTIEDPGGVEADTTTTASMTPGDSGRGGGGCSVSSKQDSIDLGFTFLLLLPLIIRFYSTRGKSSCH